MIACDSCKTGYTEEEFYDICEPVHTYIHNVAAALCDSVTVDARRCECCGRTIRFVTNKLEDDNGRASKEQGTAETR